LWIRDYHLYTGDADFARRLFPHAAAGIEEALGKIGDRGLLEWPGAWHFVEWAPGRDDDHAINSAEQAGLVATLDAGVHLADVAGREFAQKVPMWRESRERLVRAINTHLWDGKRGAYYDSLHEDGTPSLVTSQATNAAMVAFGIASEERAKELARRIVGGDPNFLSYGSPYGLFYIFEMLLQLGKVNELFSIIRDRWGEMVLAGDTTTWETFSEYNGPVWPARSRCHPFAAYILKYYVQLVLGLEPLAPGWREFRVSPRPPLGMESCSGAIPTPHGLIRVGWTRRDGKVDLRVESPPELRRVG